MARLSGSTLATLGGSWRTAVPEGFRSEMAERNMAPAVSMKSEWFMLLHWNRQTNLWKLTQTRPIEEFSWKKKKSEFQILNFNHLDKTIQSKNPYLHHFRTYKFSTRMSLLFLPFRKFRSTSVTFRTNLIQSQGVIFSLLSAFLT